MYDNNMIMSSKQKKRKFQPRIKLNHNIYITAIFIVLFRDNTVTCQANKPGDKIFGVLDPSPEVLNHGTVICQITMYTT